MTDFTKGHSLIELRALLTLAPGIPDDTVILDFSQAGGITAGDLRGLIDAADRAENERDAAIREMTHYAREAGEAKGRLEGSELAGAVDGWRERAEKAEAERDYNDARRAHWQHQAEFEHGRAEAANTRIAAMEEGFRPITWQDVRLAVGEGSLTAKDVFAGCNAELRRRRPRALLSEGNGG